MLGERSWQGMWYDPRDPSIEICGDLSFSQRDTELTLVGRLPSLADEPTPPWGLIDRPRICGLTTDGDAITLDGCIPRSATAGRGIPVERHHPGVVLVGAQYELDEDVLFDAVEFQFSHLDQWATVSGFQSSFDLDDQNALDSVSVTFTPPETIEAALSDGKTISIGFGWSVSGAGSVMTESVIKQHATLELRFPKPESLTEALTVGGQLRNFLNLAVGAPVYPTKIHGIVDPPADAVSDPLTRLTPSAGRVEVLYGLADEPEEAELSKQQQLHKMTFTLIDIIDDLAARLDKWLGNYARLKPTLDLFFAVSYGSMRYIDPQFLALAQALETYDRRTHGNQFPEWVPAGERKGRREPTLRMRLERVYRSSGAVAVRTAADSASFIEAVVGARNYYTHYDTRLEERVPRGIELVAVTAQLKALIEVLLLCELGLSVDQVDAIFERAGRYREITHLQSLVAENSAAREAS